MVLARVGVCNICRHNAMCLCFAVCLRRNAKVSRVGSSNNHAHDNNRIPPSDPPHHPVLRSSRKCVAVMSRRHVTIPPGSVTVKYSVFSVRSLLYLIFEYCVFLLVFCVYVLIIILILASSNHPSVYSISTCGWLSFLNI